MAVKPFDEKGTPIDRQIRSWSKANVRPYDKERVHPYTRTRVILMNGIEVEGALFSHQFAHHVTDHDLLQKLAMSRRVEQQQQKMVNWLVPGDESTLEVTLGYEQVAVDLTAWLARTEPDGYVKAALDFALLEDFDHLYRYANLYEMGPKGSSAAKIVGGLTEIFPGRPTISEHRHPFDDVRKPYDSAKAHPLTKLHVLTITAAEQQTMNFYMNAGNRAEGDLARGLYLEIAQIEEQHVTHYESLADPKASWFEMWALHEYNECYLYNSCMQTETDYRIRAFWEERLAEEIEHLRIARAEMIRHENRDPAEMLPAELPEPAVFQSNKEYVRQILADQVDLTAQGTEFVAMNDLPKDSRYGLYQQQVNGGGFVPSQEVVERMVASSGSDYRLETDGPHPVERFRARETVMA